MRRRRPRTGAGSLVQGPAWRPECVVNDSSPDPLEHLKNTIFVPEAKASDKAGLLAEIADSAVAAGAVAPECRDVVLQALVERERQMSTGMQYGVAIPHAKTDCVSSLVTLMAVSRTGIPFDTLDHEPATLFIATLSPPSDANSHIRFLAAVTRRLANRRVRERVFAAATKDELVAAFAEDAV